MWNKRDDTKVLNAPTSGAEVTREEIKAILADEGYSAGQRETWLKSVLTEITKQNRKQPNEARRRLIEEVKTVVDNFQSGASITDETL